MHPSPPPAEPGSIPRPVPQPSPGDRPLARPMLTAITGGGDTSTGHGALHLVTPAPMTSAEKTP